MQITSITAPASVRRNKDSLSKFIAINTEVAMSDEVRACRLSRINRDVNKWLVSELEIELRATDFSGAQL